MKSKILFVFLLLVLVCPVLAASGGFQWCGHQDIFFWNGSSDISGYKVIDHIPQIADQQEIKTPSFTSGSGKILVGSWITPNGSPGISTLAPGLWRFRTYAYSTTTSGVTTLEFVLLNRSSTGVETNLFYNKIITQDIDATGYPQEYLTSYARRNSTSFFDGDRLVIKMYASTTSVSSRQLTIDIAGNTNASMVSSSYYICPAVMDTDNIIVNETYQYSPTPATPFFAWLIFALGGIALFIMAFRRKLRDEKGGINKERIVLSLLGGVVNIFAAFLTLVVDIPNDGNHVLYQGGGLIAMIFVIMGLVCLAGLVHALLSPEMIENDENMGEEKKK